ncbi:MAG: hypothetical protein FWC94_03735 [Bacteroidales bacterium]|nr:hypothetical protein [Bacteroidales bacterium]
MKKLIKIVCTVALLSTAQNASGQPGVPIVEWDDFPAVTVFTGVNFQVSLNRIWRFEPFVEVGQHAQFFRGEWYRQIFWQTNVSSLSHYNPAMFKRSTSLRFGTDFRITANDHIRVLCHYRMPIAGGRMRADEFVFLLGYVRKQDLTARMSMDFSISYGILGSRRLMNNRNVSLGGYNFTSLEAGVRLNYNITPNLKLNFCVRYLAKLEDVSRSTQIEGIERTTRNIITASVGLHYRIPLSVNDRPQNHTLQCPPGQRNWGGPSTEFNHPNAPRARGRNR